MSNQPMPGPQPPHMPRPPGSSLHPPGMMIPHAHPPSMVGMPQPPIPGMTRASGMPRMPPTQHPPPPGVMLMQGLGQMPLLGMPQQPGFPPFGGPPGAHPQSMVNAAPPTGPPPSMPPMMVQQPPPPIPVPEEEPPAKKSKSLEDSLIPEADFLATNPSPATFSVAMPDKPEMGLQGQIMAFSIDLREPISVLKSKINEAVGLAPGKQKLRLTEGLFFKDSNSLAFYNVGSGATVYLSLKERGGRKK